MTTNRHRDLSDTLNDLQHTLWALQGLGDVMHPEHHLDVSGRSNLAMLISVLTERFETLLEEAQQRCDSTPGSRPQQPQEGDSHGMP